MILKDMEYKDDNIYYTLSEKETACSALLSTSVLCLINYVLRIRSTKYSNWFGTDCQTIPTIMFLTSEHSWQLDC